jgi:hypothetical protein
VRRGPEVVIYRETQVYIDQVIFYVVSNPAEEHVAPTTVPPGVTGKVHFITASLSEFLTKLQKRATAIGESAHEEVRALIRGLLSGAVLPAAFVDETIRVLKSPAPPGLLAKLERELGLSNIMPAPVLPVVGILASALVQESKEGPTE